VTAVVTTSMIGSALQVADAARRRDARRYERAAAHSRRHPLPGRRGCQAAGAHADEYPRRPWRHSLLILQPSRSRASPSMSSSSLFFSSPPVEFPFTIHGGSNRAAAKRQRFPGRTGRPLSFSPTSDTEDLPAGVQEIQGTLDGDRQCPANGDLDPSRAFHAGTGCKGRYAKKPFEDGRPKDTPGDSLCSLSRDPVFVLDLWRIDIKCCSRSRILCHQLFDRLHPAVCVHKALLTSLLLIFIYSILVHD